jgi:hypothetical protein
MSSPFRRVDLSAARLLWSGDPTPLVLLQATDRGVASLSELAARRVSVEEMVPIVVNHFQEVFDVELRGPLPEARRAG